MNELYARLLDECKLCQFELHDASIEISIFWSNSVKTIQPLKEFGFAIVGDSLDCFDTNYLYFHDADELIEYINHEVDREKTTRNSYLENALNTHVEVKSFNCSFNVANPDSTLFTNIVVIGSSKNRWYKRLIGGNVYLQFLVSCMIDKSGSIIYCVSYFSDEKSVLDEAICSTSNAHNIAFMINEATKFKYDFTIMETTRQLL